VLPDTRCRYHSFLSCNFFVKRFTLCYRTVVCPVCDIGELWPNGWTDQDETPQAGRPWPWSHCVRWVPMSPSRKGAEPPNFRPMCCGQLGQWIKMPLGRKVGLGPSDIVLDGDPASPPQKGGRASKFSAHVCCSQMAGWMKTPFGTEVGLDPSDIVLDGDPAPHSPKKGAQPPIFGPCLLCRSG